MTVNDTSDIVFYSTQVRDYLHEPTIALVCDVRDANVCSFVCRARSVTGA